jgi:single-strand DNA-binding protein
MNINQIIIEGRVAVDPKRAEKVDAVTFSLANNRSFKAKDSEEWQEETFFVQVVSFNKLAEKVEKTLKKGMPILVVGRLSIRSYETKNGEKKYATEIIARDVKGIQLPAKDEDQEKSSEVSPW